MAKLIETRALSGLPQTIGNVTAALQPAGRITSVAPFAGKMRAVSNAMKSQIGVGFPASNRCLIKDTATALWVGPGQALVMAEDVPVLDGQAAVTDQSDGWVTICLRGGDVEDVLARLVPVNLSPGAFKVGHTARTLVGHMTGSVTRIDRDAITVMVMRSMAETLWHDLERAMRGVAARKRI